MHHPTLCAVAIALLSALPGAQAAIYTKKSPVLQVDAKDYDRLITKSNYTSVSQSRFFSVLSSTD
jgi:protein disulfide-isomerase A6